MCRVFGVGWVACAGISRPGAQQIDLSRPMTGYSKMMSWLDGWRAAYAQSGRLDACLALRRLANSALVSSSLLSNRAPASLRSPRSVASSSAKRRCHTWLLARRGTGTRVHTCSTRTVVYDAVGRCVDEAITRFPLFSHTLSRTELSPLDTSDRTVCPACLLCERASDKRTQAHHGTTHQSFTQVSATAAPHSNYPAVGDSSAVSSPAHCR